MNKKGTITYYMIEPNGKILEIATKDLKTLKKVYRYSTQITKMLCVDDYIERDKSENLRLVIYRKVPMYKDNKKPVMDEDINGIYRADKNGEYRKIWKRKKDLAN